MGSTCESPARVDMGNVAGGGVGGASALVVAGCSGGGAAAISQPVAPALTNNDDRSYARRHRSRVKPGSRVERFALVGQPPLGDACVMESVVAKLLLLAFLIPAAAVFVVAYRHAMRHWLVKPQVTLPIAVVATRNEAAHREDLGRRFHAVAIATAFASVFIMGLVALAMVLTAIIASA
jgi:hypothetical protein